MSKPIYVGSFDDISELQINIMLFITDWCRKEKTPVPQKEIVLQMKADQVKDFTTINALNGLLRKGYIRRAFTSSHRTMYVQLRGI